MAAILVQVRVTGGLGLVVAAERAKASEQQHNENLDLIAFYQNSLRHEHIWNQNSLRHEQCAFIAAERAKRVSSNIIRI